MDRRDCGRGMKWMSRKRDLISSGDPQDTVRKKIVLEDKCSKRFVFCTFFIVIWPIFFMWPNSGWGYPLFPFPCVAPILSYLGALGFHLFSDTPRVHHSVLGSGLHSTCKTSPDHALRNLPTPWQFYLFIQNSFLFMFLPEDIIFNTFISLSYVLIVLWHDQKSRNYSCFVHINFSQRYVIRCTLT